MDDPSQNNAEAPQPPAAKNTDDYQQYLKSFIPEDTPKKSRKRGPIILITVGTATLLVVLAAAFFIQGQLSKRTVACTSDKCFNQRFSKCLPATYTYSESGNSIKYTITGTKRIGCQVSVKYLKSQHDPGLVGETMTCDFDDQLDFSAAAKNVFNYPTDYDCKGKLAASLQNSSSTANAP